MASVTFHIAGSIPEYIRHTIDGDFSMNGVLHTKYAVPALHEWHIPKGPHNVVSQWRKGSEPEVADSVQFRCMDIQMDPGIFKTV